MAPDFMKLNPREKRCYLLTPDTRHLTPILCDFKLSAGLQLRLIRFRLKTDDCHLQRPNLLPHEHRVGYGKANDGYGHQRDDVGYDDQDALTQGQGA